MLIVMKFGGTSVGSMAALQQVVSILKKARERGDEVVVVASAMSGVTDLLLSGARQAETGDVSMADLAHQEILAKHTQVIDTLLADSDCHDSVLADINELLDEFDALCHSISVLGELTPRALDVIAGMGERMSVRQIAAVLECQGIPAQAIDATHLIVTDDQYGAASPLMSATAERSQAILNPLIQKGIVPVVTGFIGATEAGIPTTLGRGGSDYSGTILGRALGADEVWIWTDVDGVMTADPRVVPDACTIPHLSYAEVGEMAYFGAKVLHPQAIRPVRRSVIPVRILNTFNPDHPGTLITKDPDGTGHTVKAVTAIKQLSLITIEGAGMIGVPGVAARTFGAVARTGTNVLMISQSSSEQSICFVVPTRESARVLDELRHEMARELERRDIERIWAQDDIVILAVVGAGMKGTPGIASRVFGALGAHRINVIAIAQGSSEYNISLVVAQGDGDEAVRRIHEEFRLGARSGNQS
ncbi:MAG: aspartate kinase [Anaerolineae bacterium]